MRIALERVLYAGGIDAEVWNGGVGRIGVDDALARDGAYCTDARAPRVGPRPRGAATGARRTGSAFTADPISLFHDHRH